MKVRAVHHRLRPVRMLIAFQIGAFGHNILQPALPSVPALVVRGAVQHGLLRGMLQVQVERGVHAQTGAVDLIAAVLTLQLPPHLFHKVGGLRVSRRFDVQPQRGELGRSRLGCRDLVVGDHLVQHQVAALQRALRKTHRRVRLRPLGQRRQQRGFRQRQVAGLLAEVELRARLKPIRSAPKINLVRIQRKDLRFGKVPLNLDGQEDLL